MHGLRFIYATSLLPENFEKYGDNYLWCFAGIAVTSSDPALRSLARRMGQERAREWRIRHPRVPDRPDPDEILMLVKGSYAADQLGVPDQRMKADLVRAARHYRARDYLGFDPAREPPPGDILDALAPVYIGDAYGVSFGAYLEDVTQWIPKLRPYRDREDVAYTITHLVYVLNGYSRYRLRPEWLPEEFEFLRANLKQTIAADDPETVGEFLDTLKSFGLTEDDALIGSGTEFLLSRQNPDGSWGDPEAEDIYSRYHPTWTAIDGLRDYRWQGEGVTSVEALRRAARKIPSVIDNPIAKSPRRGSRDVNHR